MTQRQILESVCRQLSIDYNCAPEDFFKSGFIYTEAKQNEGRRPWPWITPRLEMITMGSSLVVNATSDILPLVEKRMEGKTAYETLNMPFVYGVNPYYLPDLNKVFSFIGNNNYSYSIIEKKQVVDIIMQYNMDLQSELDMVAVTARHGDTLIGMASATVECEKLCQINVEVIPEYRGKNFAATMVNIITVEMLNRDYIPYYSTGCSNIISQRVAVRSGYTPAWSHCFRTRLELL